MRGWWTLKIEEVDDNFIYNQIDLEHIAECIVEGYKSGELINEEEKEEE